MAGIPIGNCAALVTLGGMQTTNDPELRLVYEDSALLVVNKPARVATMGFGDGRPELMTVLRRYLSTGTETPFVGILGRLDVPVSGLLVVAKSSLVARQLMQQRASQKLKKKYHALVHGHPVPGQGELTDWIVKSRRRRRVDIVPGEQPDAQLAHLSYEVLRSGSDRCLLDVTLHTGRKHQIRAQLGHFGYPILGDRKYGSRQAFPDGITLLCQEVRLEHPESGAACVWNIDYPESWADVLTDVL